MAYYTYDSFGTSYASGVKLPITLQPYTDGAGAVSSYLVDLPGRGSYDTLSGGTATAEAYTITHRGRVTASTESALQGSLDAWYALRGKRSQLWKSNDGGTTTRWRYARLLDVRTDVGLGSAPYWSIVEMDFELAAALWCGSAHAETTTLATGTVNASTTNAGNTRVRNAIITITAAASAIGTVSVYKASLIHWHYTGSIAAGQALIVNGSTKSVTNNGNDDYVHFALQTSHADNDWTPIEPGLGTLSVERYGGGTASTINLSYYDGFS